MEKSWKRAYYRQECLLSLFFVLLPFLLGCLGHVVQNSWSWKQLKIIEFQESHM